MGGARAAPDAPHRERPPAYIRNLSVSGRKAGSGRLGDPQLALCGKLRRGRAKAGGEGLWAAGRPRPGWAETTEPRFAVSWSRFPLGSTMALMTGKRRVRQVGLLPAPHACPPRLPPTPAPHHGPLGPRGLATPTFQLLLHPPQLLQDGADLLQVRGRGSGAGGAGHHASPRSPAAAALAFPLRPAPHPVAGGLRPGDGRSPRAPRAPGAPSLTLLDVFRMGTSFSALIFASRSSHARPVFWKRILCPGVGAGAAEA